MPTKEEIKEWLKEIGKDRFWLAQECGVTKPSVDGWFTTRGNVPAKALLVIQQLMDAAPKKEECGEDQEPDVITSLDFSEEEMEVVRRFQKNFPGIDLENYLRNKVIELCAGLDKQNKFLIERDETTSKVAEDSAEYGNPTK